MIEKVVCRAGRLDEFALAAELRHAMSIEMDEDFDARGADWRPKYCMYYGAKQDAGKAQLFLAFEGDEPVGMAVVALVDDYRTELFGTPYGYINGVYVRPRNRRQGVARRLMELAVDWARERGCVAIRLRATDDGRPLYESMGFRTASDMVLRF